MNIKIFKVKQGNETPCFSNNKFNLSNNISDYFISKCKMISGNEVYNVVCYDFKNKKWICVSAGLDEVLEYYIE